MADPEITQDFTVLDAVEQFVEAGFATVSRNPSDYEMVTAWREAVRLAYLAPSPSCQAAIAQQIEKDAGIAESVMLPCDIGGDLILERYSADTIAAAIRAQKP